MASFTLLLFFALMTSSVFSQDTGKGKPEDDNSSELNEINEAEEEESAGVFNAIEAANGRVGQSRSGPRFMQGDVALPSNLGRNRNASPCTARGCTWPKHSNGLVYIPIGISNKYSNAEIHVIIKSLVSFFSVSCIRFTWRRSQRDYLYFYPSTGCWSYIGRQSGLQLISLKQGGCVDKGIIQHEVLHALGFHHEQSRSDRDDFVDIIRENIRPGLESNFDKVNTNNLATPYDYNSIMHYGRFAFSNMYGVLPTIVAKPTVTVGQATEMSANDIKPTIVAKPTVTVGQATEMSANDIKRINALYKCS